MSDKPLPGILQAVQEVAGVESAIRLAKAFGGTTVYLPERVAPDGALAAAVGYDAARKIVAALGKGHLVVPLGPRFWDRRLAAAIEDMLARGRSLNQIARALGVTQRTVVRHKRLLAERAATDSERRAADRRRTA